MKYLSKDDKNNTQSQSPSQSLNFVFAQRKCQVIDFAAI